MVGPLVSYAVMMWIGISKYSVLGVKDTLDFPTHSCPSNLNLTTFVTSGVHNYSIPHGNQSLMVTGLSVAMTTAIPQVTQDRSVCIFNVLLLMKKVELLIFLFTCWFYFWMMSSCHYIAPRLFKQIEYLMFIISFLHLTDLLSMSFTPFLTCGTPLWGSPLL